MQIGYLNPNLHQTFVTFGDCIQSCLVIAVILQQQLPIVFSIADWGYPTQSVEQIGTKEPNLQQMKFSFCTAF